MARQIEKMTFHRALFHNLDGWFPYAEEKSKSRVDSNWFFLVFCHTFVKKRDPEKEAWPTLTRKINNRRPGQKMTKGRFFSRDLRN